MDQRRLSLWTIATTALSSIIGIGLYLGAIHSGGPSIWVAGFVVPPLFLDLSGYLKIDSFSLWLVVVVTLQLLLVASVVYGFAWLTRIMRTRHDDSGAI